MIIPPEFKTYEKNGFATPSGKVEFVSQVLERYRDSHGYSGLPEYRDYRQMSGVDQIEYPYILNTGSRKPQFFHSRTYRMPWLANLEQAPLVELHPEDAAALGVEGRRTGESDFTGWKHVWNGGIMQQWTPGCDTYLSWQSKGGSK